jgi:hypothetical protein
VINCHIKIYAYELYVKLCNFFFKKKERRGNKFFQSYRRYELIVGRLLIRSRLEQRNRKRKNGSKCKYRKGTWNTGTKKDEKHKPYILLTFL